MSPDFDTPCWRTRPWATNILDLRHNDDRPIPTQRPPAPVCTWSLPATLLSLPASNPRATTSGQAVERATKRATKRATSRAAAESVSTWIVTLSHIHSTLRRDRRTIINPGDHYLLITSPAGETHALVLTDRDEPSQQAMSATVPALSALLASAAVDDLTQDQAVLAAASVHDLHRALSTPQDYLTSPSNASNSPANTMVHLWSLPRLAAAGAQDVDDGYVIDRLTRATEHWYTDWVTQPDPLDLHEARAWRHMGVPAAQAGIAAAHGLNATTAEPHLDSDEIRDADTLIAVTDRGWSPRTVTGIYRLLRRTHRDLDIARPWGSRSALDTVVADLARIPDLNLRDARAAIKAGLLPGEIASLVATNSMDRKGFAVMAALRQP